MAHKTIIILITLLLSFFETHATIWHVRDTNTIANADGLTWNTGYNNLFYPLLISSPGDTIWVAKGLYELDHPYWAYSLKNNVAVYGGFAGDETQLSQRNWQQNITRLNGRSEHNCVIDNTTALDSTAVLDGVTIAYDDYMNFDAAGAMHNENASPTIRNCTFLQNFSNTYYAGGIYNINSSPKIINCFFIENVGGAIINVSGSSPQIVNCTFIGNRADQGAAIYNTDNCSLSITNSLFYQNFIYALGNATAIYNVTSDPVINNCTFFGNFSFAGGNTPTIFNASSNAVINNSIIWGNDGGVSGSAQTRYSLIQGTPADSSNHNIAGNTNPLFVDTSAANFKLATASPCINSGHNAFLPQGINMDLAGVSRIFGNTVDMGAYEFESAPIADLGNDTTICSQQPITLDAQNQISEYIWSTGDTTQTINVTTSGTYFVTVTNALGSSSDTINIIVNASPVVQLGNDTTLQIGETIILDAGNAGAVYLWNTMGTTQTIAVNDPGLYSVTVSNGFGCSSRDSININFSSVGFQELNIDTPFFSIYPNPAKGFLNITVNQFIKPIDCAIYNLNGKLIKRIRIVQKNERLDMRNFISGTYYLKPLNGEGIKFTIQ
ncbi:T9SS type A sorting domain-containing protein [Taibaiella lutea]|uniref:T9SS type A sorting domain-containing protein n=1 Tax=Taibaiella lutea TaxID=2608001 RepID=A0A5M6CDI3_9BACT|nr:T9SS type A sorting domain-containing protein [Taibaiella lutea]KAA5533161.1 T9SS type A sorting domain-containing protein [Taibaiella lutea]